MINKSRQQRKFIVVARRARHVLRFERAQIKRRTRGEPSSAAQKHRCPCCVKFVDFMLHGFVMSQYFFIFCKQLRHYREKHYILLLRNITQKWCNSSNKTKARNVDIYPDTFPFLNSSTSTLLNNLPPQDC